MDGTRAPVEDGVLPIMLLIESWILGSKALVSNKGPNVLSVARMLYGSRGAVTCYGPQSLKVINKAHGEG